jgi:hypothetical protein
VRNPLRRLGFGNRLVLGSTLICGIGMALVVGIIASL